MVPQLRYVDAAIGVGQNTLGQKVTYLLEEEIEEEQHGRFIKYINNNLAHPMPRLTEKETDIALFLCFCQHLQYNLTDKQMFVTDWQGMV